MEDGGVRAKLPSPKPHTRRRVTALSNFFCPA